MLLNINLRQFRSYLDDSFEFSDGVNIIIGPNGSGKTNLIEAILLIASNKSYRLNNLNLIQHNKNWFKITAEDDKQLIRSLSYKLTNYTLEKKYTINEVSYIRLPYLKTLPVILFEPNNLNLFTGGPERRRLFFDELAEKIYPGFDKIINQYKRVLIQRNTLIREKNFNKTSIFPWNIKLSELASQIVINRTQLINSLNLEINDIYYKISGSTKYNTKILYHPTFSEDTYNTKILNYLEKNLNIDIQYGYTTIGPHREDITIEFNNKSSSVVASRGEIRTLILVLKILESKYIEKIRNIKPIFLLDDVFSELDGSRRKFLTEYINNYQTFITTTDADVVIKNFTEKANIIPIK